MLHLNGKTLEWYVPVLLRRIPITFRLQHGQRLNQLLARIARWDDGIDESAVRDYIRIGEAIAELFDLVAAHLIAVRPGRVEFAFVNDVDRALRSHHCYLSGRPRIVHIRANMF